MKKLIFVLAIFVAVPAFAALKVEVVDMGSNQVAINYSGADANNLPRAFALDLTIASPGTFDDVTGYYEGECGPNSPAQRRYGIYPARITFDVNNDVDDWGSPLANPNDPGAGTGLATSHIVLEFASLYVDPNIPTTSGTLCTVAYNCHGGESTAGLNIVLDEEELYRGGVVLEDGTQAEVNDVLAVCKLTDCFPSTFTTYNDWKTMGKPSCWCNNTLGGTGSYQCDGDAATNQEGLSKYRVYTTDLGVVIANWKKKISNYPATLNPCADVDHKYEGLSKYRVYTVDLGRVIANWKKKDTGLPANCGLLSRPE